MAQSSTPLRAAFRDEGAGDPHVPDGAWWPYSRDLALQLPSLIDGWPVRVRRILYSSPDWDDHPRSVEITGRRIKTGTFPRDDTHLVTLVLADGSRRTITVIDPASEQGDADRALAAFGASSGDQPR